MPNACCRVVCKCTTKLLINRMKWFISDMVSLNQSAFIVGRHIHDSILLSHKLLHNYKDEEPPRYDVKVDLRKAYDSVR